MDSKKEEKVLTASTVDELNQKVRKLETDIVEQGWHTEGSVITNDDKSLSQTMVREVK